MVDVFISYSRGDQPAVRRLAEAVRREGYSVWWDQELPPHRSYGDVITEQIGAAKAAIVVWSAQAAASEWVRAEADVARNQKKLIQTSLDGHPPPMPFNQIQFAMLGDWRGEATHPGWLKVKESLAALCGAPGTERPLYPMPAAPPPAAGNRRRLLAAAAAILLLAAGTVGTMLWWRENPPVAAPAAAEGPKIRLSAPAEPPPDKRPEPAPATPRVEAAPAQAERRAPTAPRPAAGPREMRRYCMGPGRGTPQCVRLRQRRMRQGLP